MNQPGYRDTATCKDNHERFVRRVVECGQVWGLKGDNGWAFAESNENEETSVLLFWSDEPYARRAQSEFTEYTPATISLFDFLYRWLPGMTRDGLLVGTNWTGDLVGIETDPFNLREEIEAKLSPELTAQYKTKYEELSG